MMRRLFAVALNDLRIELSDRNSYIELLLLPLLFTAVIGAAMRGFGGNPSGDQRLPVALVDHDAGPQAEALREDLAASTVVRLVALDEAQALDRLADGALIAVAVVPTGFSDALQAGEPAEVALYAAPGDNLGIMAGEELQAAAARVSATTVAALLSAREAEAIQPFADDAERQAYLVEARALAAEMATAPPVALEARRSASATQSQVPSGFALSSPGQLVTWVLSTLLAGAVLLVSERAGGTLRRLVVMPATRWAILGGKIVGRLTLGLAQMAVMVLFGQFVLGVNWGNSLPAMALVAVSYGLAATALGVFLATISRTQQQASGFVALGTFLLAPLGGAWIPLEVTPPAYQAVAQALPTTWAMRGFTDVVVRGQGPGGVLLECAVLLGFAALFFALGIWRFRYE